MLWWPGRGGAGLALEGDGSERFLALVRGKRVAVVGPALTLLGTRAGPVIDAFDVVVRFNEAFDPPAATADLARDVGRRCDIVYANQVVLREHLVERSRREQRELLSVASRAGLRYLVCTNNSLSYSASGVPQQSCPRSDRRIPVMADRMCRAAGDVRLRLLQHASVRATTLLEGCYGRTGFIAILDLLGCAVSELFLTGMSFYHDGGHRLAPAGSPLHPCGNRDGSSAMDASGRGHDSTRELAVLRELRSRFPTTLRLDEPLAKLLHYEPDLAKRSLPH